MSRLSTKPATRHHLNPFWPSSLTYICRTREEEGLSQIDKQINTILSVVKCVNVTYIYRLSIENFHPSENWWKILLRMCPTLSVRSFISVNKSYHRWVPQYKLICKVNLTSATRHIKSNNQLCYLQRFNDNVVYKYVDWPALIWSWMPINSMLLYDMFACAQKCALAVYFWFSSLHHYIWLRFNTNFLIRYSDYLETVWGSPTDHKDIRHGNVQKRMQNI